jgi:hypothetical protein
LFAGKRMELEITMLSKISQIEKDKYHMFFHRQNIDLKNNEWNKCKIGGLEPMGGQKERGKDG